MNRIFLIEIIKLNIVKYKCFKHPFFTILIFVMGEL